MLTEKLARLIVLLTLLVSQANAKGLEVEANRFSIMVIGDSLSAGYGITADQGWVSLLGQRAGEKSQAYQIVNASISGDTTQGGLKRLPDALERTRPAVVIIELGANDGLRGFKLTHIKDNLREMIQLSKQASAKVLLLGIKLPANYGKSYGARFHQIFLDLAEEEAIAVVPFFLKDVAQHLELMQSDGIHPTARAQPIILNNVWPGLAGMLLEE